MIIYNYNNAKIKIACSPRFDMNKGILLYGFTRHDAEDLRSQIEHAVSAGVVAWGAPSEDEAVLTVLEGDKEGLFEDCSERCVMFVGFSGSEIQAVLREVEFPPPVSPLLCCPTESNVTWPFGELIEHLKEERDEIERSRTERGD